MTCKTGVLKSFANFTILQSLFEKRPPPAQVFSCEIGNIFKNTYFEECQLTAGSVLNYVGPVSTWVLWVSCHRAIVSSCLRLSKIFSRGYFVGLKFLLVSILWVQDFSSFKFRGSKIFSRWYFVGPKFFLVGISLVRNFSSCVFRGSKFFFVDIS